MIYKIYIAFFFLSLLVYHFDKISKKIKPLFYKTKNAVKNPRIGRDISLAAFAIAGVYLAIKADDRKHSTH